MMMTEECGVGRPAHSARMDFPALGAGLMTSPQWMDFPLR